MRVDHCAHIKMLYLKTFHEDSDWAELKKIRGGTLEKPEKGPELMIVE